MSDEHKYTVSFVVDGSLSVVAFSPKHARKLAIEALECLDVMDAEAFDVEGCTVRVVARITDELPSGCELLNEPPQCVEFTS